MREIKFRYWNRTNNIMVNNPEMPYKKGWTIEQLFSDRGWIWMQYTGLKDKNGKEIYEGDILKVDWGGIQDEYILGNKYDKPFVMEWRGYEYPPFSRYLPTPDCVEVLGNIYENSELINQPEL